MTGNQVFLDSAYAIALASRSERAPCQSGRAGQAPAGHRVQILTTRSVCFEIGNALARLRFRPTAIEFLDSLERSPTTRIVPDSEGLYSQALYLFRQRSDKEWSLTDCLSFVVMSHNGLSEALTSDEHFQQAGFKALLRA